MRIERAEDVKPSHIEAFLSYADKDKHCAHSIKEGLEKLGIELFVSHDDMHTGQNWADHIIGKITSCECFIQLITESYHEANYTEQEAGIALALKKDIFPITTDNTVPIGFTQTRQCEKFDLQEPDYLKLMNNILNGMKRDTINWSIHLLPIASSFNTANRIIDNIVDLLNGKYLNEYQITTIQEAAANNFQVGGAFKLKRLFEHVKDEHRYLLE